MTMCVCVCVCVRAPLCFAVCVSFRVSVDVEGVCVDVLL